jgi:uncharacterized membrane protein
MFLIFKILPDWIWWLLLASGLIGFFASYLPLAKKYAVVFKSFGLITTASTIFILGALYADNTWKQAAKELEAKVQVAEAQSQAANETIKEKIIYRTQIVKQRGTDTVQYIDREVTKYDTTCVIPLEFITAHNRAAEPPK